MKLNVNILEVLIVYVIFDVIILRLIFASFLRRQMNRGKGRRYLVGVSLIFLGVILTSFGLFLGFGSIPYQGWTINSGMIAGVAPFLLFGIPSLILGIFLINNP